MPQMQNLYLEALQQYHKKDDGLPAYWGAATSRRARLSEEVDPYLGS